MKTKTHTRYRTKDNTVVPGVTTITGQVGKEALINWAWKLGTKGEDYKKVRDEKAEIGTLAHEWIHHYILEKEMDLSDFTQNQIKQADIIVRKFLEWEKENDLYVLESELNMVSEKYRYGGCLDIYCILNGKKCILDLKTGSSTHFENHIQVGGGYRQLAIEHELEVDECYLLWCNADNMIEAREIKIYKEDMLFDAFKSLLDYYYTKKKIGYRR